jgi:hypothetical protein
MTDWDEQFAADRALSTAGGSDPGLILRRLVAAAIRVDVDASGEADGRLDVVERGDSPAPAARALDLLAGGDEPIVGVVPRIDPALARGLSGSVDGDVRLVLTGNAGERLTGAFGLAIRNALGDRGVNVFVHDGDSPVAVLLVAERAVVGLFDGDGLAALAWSDDPVIREWAAATCRRYLSAADSI